MWALRYSNICIFFVLFTFLLLSSSCSSKRYLPEGEKLLTQTSIEMEEPNDDPYLTSAKGELKNIPQLRPNSSILWFIPKERSYLRIQQKQDTTAWNRFILRNFAEEPAFYDSLKIANAERAFERHMRSRGYFNARVDHEVEFKRYKAKVKYRVTPGRLFLSDTLQYTTEDTEVKDLLLKHKNESIFRQSVPISRENYEKESRRITRLLRNNGYYEFYSNYISNIQLGDTSRSLINVSINIAPPRPDSIHRKYTVRDIRVFPDHNPFAEGSPSFYDEVNGISYYFRDEPRIKLSRIENNIFFSPGDLYKSDQYDRTIRQLGNLSYYRFPSIIINPDTTDGGYHLDYELLLRPNNQIVDSRTYELSFSRVQNVTSLLGFSFSNTLENRNVFGGSERLLVNFEAGLEIALRSISTGNSFNIRLGADLISPKFEDYTGMFRVANFLRVGDRRLLGNDFFNQIKTEGDVNLNVNLGVSQYQHFYSYTFFNTSYGISLQRTQNKFYDITMLGINYWSPRQLSDFDNLIGEDILFRRRFNKRLITGFLFKELTFRYETRPNRFGESYSALFNFELSGHEIGLINSISRLLSGDKLIDEIKIGSDNISFAKYVKTDIDARYTKAYSQGRSLALRGFVGMALPLSETSNIPYIKQYFAGGAYSVRAWQLRELGPGSLRDTLADDRNLLFYQAGDFRLEFNAEYRFDLIWVLEGAAFVDVGNVWNLDGDAGRETRLKWDFYKEFAIGAGIGLRFNFDFFIARFDFAYKVKTPYKDPITNSYWAIRSPSDLKLRNISVNFAIGYPF